jgi:hypothetical protein
MADNILQYEIYRTTDFNEYTAVVTADHQTEETTIFLYIGEPVSKSFFGLYEEKKESVRDGYLSSVDDVDYAVYQLITDYELHLWQKQKAEMGGKKLTIDYEKEIRKRNTKSNQPSNVIEGDFPTITFKEWDDPETYYITSSGRKMHINSLKNLPQNQHLRDLG